MNSSDPDTPDVSSTKLYLSSSAGYETKSTWDFASPKSSPLRRSIEVNSSDKPHSPSSGSPYSYTNLSFEFQNAVAIANNTDASNCNNVAPEIASRTQDTAVQVGTSVVLSCVIRNLNDAKVLWRKTEPSPPLLIQNTSSKYSVSVSSGGEARLIINHTEPQDSGVYACFVSNQYGIVQCTIGLTVISSDNNHDRYVSECSTDIYLEVINPTSVRVSWDYTASTTNSYIIEYCRTGSKTWKSNDDKPVRSRYILNGLTPGETYTFRLLCANTNVVSLPSASVTMPLSEQHMWQQQQFNNRYSSLSELGRGRFAIIRLATDAVTGQKVALKQVSRKHQDLITTKEEYRLLASAQHPNIVRGLALFENAPHQGIDTIVMEL